VFNPWVEHTDARFIMTPLLHDLVFQVVTDGAIEYSHPDNATLSESVKLTTKFPLCRLDARGEVIVVVGAVVSAIVVFIVNVFIAKALLAFPAASVTVTVQLLYVQSAKVVKVTVLFPLIALTSSEGIQDHP